MKVIGVNQPGGFDNLAIIEKPDPKPATGQVVVKWHATSLNFHDYLVAVGGIPVPNGRVPMSDGAGEIIAIGEGVDEWKIGDKVMSMFFPNWLEGKPTLKKTMFILGETIDGCMAEQSVLPGTAVTKIPEGYTYAAAATLPTAGLTAWRALMVEGNIEAGDKVLVQGTGGMSIFALQLAKMAGAKVFAKITLLPKAFLWSSVLCFATIGAYSVASSFFDVWLMAGAGFVGFLMLRHGFGPAPLIMGLILGKMVEESFSQSMIVYDNEWWRLLERPICVGLSVITALSLSWPLIKRMLPKKQKD